MPSELLAMNEKRMTAVAYLQRWIGTPYRYGGDDFSGWDCSGVIHETLQAVGIEDRGFDSTAHDLWIEHSHQKVDKGYAGCLVFWFKVDNRVQHVAMMIDDARVVHAAGGGSNTLSVVDAIRDNAYVRMDDLEKYSKKRGQRYVICDPFKVGT